MQIIRDRDTPRLCYEPCELPLEAVKISLYSLEHGG